MLDKLQSVIGYDFVDPKILSEAVTHRSYKNECRERGMRDNQRLEFFGDAVLGLIVSRLLLDRFITSCEGRLSRLRASLVDEATLAGLAEGFGLGEFLLLGRGEDKTGGRYKKSVLADAFESVIAAVYLDGGLEAASNMVERFFAPLIDRIDVGFRDRDYKTRFQELCQALSGRVPTYLLEGVSGPDHARVFTVSAMVGEERVGTATGRSKKEAEQAAARSALELLEQRKADDFP
jgi:ribonuclease III